MQDKFEMFNELPKELGLETAQNLPTYELVNLSQTSKHHLSFFKPMVEVRKLLHYVVRGMHDEVQLILSGDINLIFKRGKVTDCSGRVFENVSGFEYALWALDKHMWAQMIGCISKNEEGRTVFAELIAQYNKVNTDGVTYRLNGETITEQHFDFENILIKEQQMQMDSLNAPGAKNLDLIDKQWREGVGGAPKQLPMHIVYEYCSNEPFEPVPEFISQPKSSKQVYNWRTDESVNWFNVGSKLGSRFAIYKGCSKLAFVVEARGSRGGSGFDLVAMVALCEVRTLDLINLKS